MVSQYFKKKSGLKPSGPGALFGCIWKRASLIPVVVKFDKRKKFWAVVTLEGTWQSMACMLELEGLVELNKLLK